MMPVLHAGSSLDTRTALAATSDIATGGITSGDWLVFVAGIVIGALTVFAPILVAWRQRVIQIRDRSVDRVEREQYQQAELERQARVARREVWEAEYEEIRELIKLGEDIAYKVRNTGPHTASELTALGSAEFTMEAEQLSGRGVEALRAPLLKLADLAKQISDVAVPEDAEVLAAYATQHRPVTDPLSLHAIQRLAILQDRAAHELANEINLTWQALRNEWGG